MGQTGFKSSCCTNGETALNTEIETRERDDIVGRKELFGKIVDDKRSFARVKGGADPANDDLSLTYNKDDNRIITNHIRTASRTQLAKDATIDPINRIKQLAELVHYAPLLKLKVISSSSLPKGTIINVNAQGVEASFRSAKDGITFFGCKKRPKRIAKHIRQTEILNDYILPAVNKEIGKKHRGRHFQIEYNVPSNSYKIKDLGVGFGTFYKLDFPLVLKDNHLLNMGLIFMVVNLLNNDSSTNGRPNLHLKFFGGPCTGEVHVLEPTDKPISIGRHSECSIHVEDNLLSKNQCTIEFTENNGWILKDGKDKRPSTNGTWLYIGEEQTIYNGMIFKANQTLFQASII
jgi:hypothetical protein